MVNKCTFDTCTREAVAKGLCSAHRRQAETGKPLIPLKPYKTMPYGTDRDDWFWELVLKTDFCWLWRGGKIPSGFGKFVVDGVQVYAHRHSYELKYGPIPGGGRVSKLCKVPECVNPEHMVVK